MRLESPYQEVGRFDSALRPPAAVKADAAARSLEPGFLELTVGSLLVLWWLQMFGAWTGFLTWAASLGIPSSF
jgi:hypothetical protein